MLSSRPPRKPDLFVVLLLVVAAGMSATLAYQVNLYYNNDDLALASQTQDAPPVVRR
jgi:hypothetical protein